MMSDYPELFAGLNDAERVVPQTNEYLNFVRAWRRKPDLLYFTTLSTPDRDVPPRQHIIAEFCARAGVKGSIDLRPYLELTPTEKVQESWACGRVVI